MYCYCCYGLIILSRNEQDGAELMLGLGTLQDHSDLFPVCFNKVKKPVLPLASLCSVYLYTETAYIPATKQNMGHQLQNKA